MCQSLKTTITQAYYYREKPVVWFEGSHISEDDILEIEALKSIDFRSTGKMLDTCASGFACLSPHAFCYCLQFVMCISFRDKCDSFIVTAFNL